MIKSFADRETEKLFQREFSRRFPPEIQHRVRIKLEILDASESLEDLHQPPANHLEALSGNRQGQHSIRVNLQWRICFVWKEGNTYAVELVDYHK
jgi:toxin HigB-1